jgi:hypothetical protein
MKKIIMILVGCFMLAATGFSDLQLSFESSMDGWVASSTNITLSRVAENATDGTYAVKTEHATGNGYTAVMKIDNSSSLWWSAMQDAGNTNMSIDFYVPSDAVLTTWASVSLRLQGDGFDETYKVDLVTGTNNTGTLSFDFASIKSDIMTASWGKAELIMNGGVGTTLTPAYFDNYRVFGDGTVDPVGNGLLHSFEEGLQGWFPLATEGAITNLTVPDVPAEAVTYGTHAIKATHADPAGGAELMRISSGVSAEWWTALQHPDNKYMQVDLFVPGEAIQASWANVSLVLQGDGFNATAMSNLVKQVDNQLTLVLDYSSITNEVQAGGWGQVTIVVNAGSGSTRTPVYIDNYQIYAENPVVDNGGGSTNEPPPTVDPALLTIEQSGASFLISTTNLSDHTAVTNTLQSKASMGATWDDLYSVTGVTATNWLVAPTNSMFFRILSTY